ncbi:MAG TPA: hypothetical protein VGM44_25625 [Polyangiaceae bacterium]
MSLDFIFFEPNRARVWVPAGGSGSVDVFDLGKREFARIEGFATAEHEAHGKKRVMGPSSGAVGDGVVYVGNRANKQVCMVDTQTLKQGACVELAAPPDCVEYVARSREVWVTTPSAHSLAIIETAAGAKFGAVSTLSMPGEPEGYAVDEPRGLFLTNLEDRGSTLAVDVKSRSIKSTWEAGCGPDGPRGIAVDSAHSFVFVACTDHVQVLDSANRGARLGVLDTGAGLDNIDYVPSTGSLYAAAGKAARLTIARLEGHGELKVIASVATAPGARNAVADAKGNVYLTDGQGANLLRVAAPE